MTIKIYYLALRTLRRIAICLISATAITFFASTCWPLIFPVDISTESRDVHYFVDVDPVAGSTFLTIPTYTYSNLIADVTQVNALNSIFMRDWIDAQIARSDQLKRTQNDSWMGNKNSDSQYDFNLEPLDPKRIHSRKGYRPIAHNTLASMYDTLYQENHLAYEFYAIRTGFPFRQQIGFFTFRRYDSRVIESTSFQFFASRCYCVWPTAAGGNLQDISSIGPIPLQIEWGGLFMNVTLWFLIVIASVQAFDKCRTFWRRRAGKCEACGYPRCGSNCPECGAVLSTPTSSF